MIGRLDSGGENKHIQKVFNMSEVLQGKYYKGGKVYAVGDVDTDRHHILFAAVSAAVAAIPIKATKRYD
ncbi:MAG TPA: hypothetical protein VFS97_04860 [Nitrososphaeraceae archaeon]|nr:hypothetical protein [Nitrososphaeraceae archaeon]